jgi:ABC-2 type transport system permease protein
MTSFITLLRRELWEHTSLRNIPFTLLVFVILANLAFMFVVGSAGSSFTININNDTSELMNYIDFFSQMDSDKQASIINGTMITTGMIINSILLIVMFFYLLDSLYGERKDRTILFWKSLPVSNRTTVLSKLSVATIIVPVIIFITTVLANLITLALQSYTLFHNQHSVGLLWQQVDMTGLSLFSIFLLLQQTIWYFPVMGWLLFCSAWCRKPPIIVAALIPAMLVFIDSSFMLGTGISEILLERLPVGIMSMQLGQENSLMNYPYSMSEQQLPGYNMMAGIRLPAFEDILRFIGNMKVWVGILIGILFIGLAISLRRWRDDSL